MLSDAEIDQLRDRSAARKAESEALEREADDLAIRYNNTRSAFVVARSEWSALSQVVSREEERRRAEDEATEAAALAAAEEEAEEAARAAAEEEAEEAARAATRPPISSLSVKLALPVIRELGLDELDLARDDEEAREPSPRGAILEAIERRRASFVVGGAGDGDGE